MDRMPRDVAIRIHEALGVQMFQGNELEQLDRSLRGAMGFWKEMQQRQVQAAAARHALIAKSFYAWWVRIQ